MTWALSTIHANRRFVSLVYPPKLLSYNNNQVLWDTLQTEEDIISRRLKQLQIYVYFHWMARMMHITWCELCKSLSLPKLKRINSGGKCAHERTLQSVMWWGRNRAGGTQPAWSHTMSQSALEEWVWAQLELLKDLTPAVTLDSVSIWRCLPAELDYVWD